MMTLHKAFHPQEDIDSLYVSRGGRWLTNIEDCVDASIQGHKNYIKKKKERLITTANNSMGNIRKTVKQQKLENVNGKNNNCVDISRDKLARLHERRWGDGYERKPLREKLNLD